MPAVDALRIEVEGALRTNLGRLGSITGPYKIGELDQRHGLKWEAMTPQGVKIGTVFVDTFGANPVRHEAVIHSSENVARRYAVELTNRRKGRTEVFVGNRLVGVYEDGANIAAAKA